MADIINPLSWGKTAQNAIDMFIDLWMTGLDKITGGDPVPNVQAPMPFYEAGQGYWFSYNDVVSDTAPAYYGWSYAMVDWVMFTKDEDDRIPYIELDVGGVEDSSRPAEWNSAVLAYWNKDIIQYGINDAGIINSGADYLGIQFRADTADPSAVAGLKSTDEYFWYKDIIDAGVWRKFDGTVANTFSRVAIVQNNDSYVYSGAPNPASGNHLNLPRTANGYWVSISHPQGNETLINNYYDTIKNHNENNEYVTNNNYNSFYNTYEVTLKDGTDVNVGFGPAGFGIAVGGVAGGAVGIEPKIDFDDLIDILSPMVNDLNDDAGYDVELQLHDFDYYVSRYKDYGSFYIHPLHQLPPLPTAPDIADTVIDVSQPLGILSNGFGALLSSFDSLGVTLTLTFTFLSCLVINKLRGD